MPKNTKIIQKETKGEVLKKPQKSGKIAVIDISGHQHLVEEGDVLELDNQAAEVGAKINAEKVLLVVNDSGPNFGRPYVTGARVSLEVLENKKGKKIEVMKYKAKSRYRKHIGYRSHLTVVKVTEIKV